MTLLQKIQNLTWYNGIGKLREILIELFNSGGGIEEAPEDNKQYARKNAQWEEVNLNREEKEVSTSESPYTFVEEDKSKCITTYETPDYVIPKDVFSVGDRIVIKAFSDYLSITKEPGVNFKDIYYDGTTERISNTYIVLEQKNLNYWELIQYITPHFTNGTLTKIISTTDTISKYNTLYYASGGIINVHTNSSPDILIDPQSFFEVQNTSTDAILEVVGTDESNGDYFLYNGVIVNSIELFPGEKGYFKLKPYGSFPLYWNFTRESSSKLPVLSNNFSNDSTAAAGGILVGDMYHTSGTVKIRLT